jgi:hypothetical protein
MTYRVVWTLNRGNLDPPEPLPPAQQHLAWTQHQLDLMAERRFSRERDPQLTDREHIQEEGQRRNNQRTTGRR